MTDKERLGRAVEFATEKHKGQFRIGGLPYITHPLAVCEIVKNKGYGVEYQIAGLFHDLLEDTTATEKEIEDIGGKDVLTAVKLLTKPKGYVMETYIGGIIGNDIARAVKAADRLHNLRSAVTTNDDFKRRYILESLDWFMDFDPEIPKAVKDLALTMTTPIKDLSLLYKPVDNWLENKDE